MPVYAADLLPDATGRNLGNSSQRWNAYAQNLDVLGTFSYQPVAGAILGASGVVYVATAPVTAAASITTGQNLCSCTIPAGLLNAPGKVLRATMGGTYNTQAGQTPVLSFGVYLGSAEVFGVYSAALPSAAAGLDWNVTWLTTVYQAGTAASLVCQGALLYQASGDIATSATSIYDTAGPLDLTTAQPLVCECLFTTNTSPANSCIQRIFVVEVLN